MISFKPWHGTPLQAKVVELNPLAKLRQRDRTHLQLVTA